MGQPIIQRTFAGGELAPALAARADIVKYVTALRKCRNFVVLRSGGVANRAGFRFVGACKTSAISKQLHRYVAATPGDSVLIESGNGYLRFFRNGGAVTVSGVPAYNAGNAYTIGDVVSSGGINYYCQLDAAPGQSPPGAQWYAMTGSTYEIPHPFSTGGWMASQSGNVITMTSKVGGVPPYELIYNGLTSWVIRPVDTEPAIAAPAGLNGTAGDVGTLTYAYQVTAGSADGYEESLSAGVASVPNCAEPTVEKPNQLSWTAVPGAAEYYIYCDPYGNGTFGFIGTATCDNSVAGTPTVFNDVGFTPDFSVTPPLARQPFNAVGDYPRVGGNHQQRRLFANTDNNPDAVYGSRVGFISNFSISSPLQDDDAITFKIAGTQHNPVRHLIGLKTLVVMTDGGVWNVGQPLVPLTPSSLAADQDGYIGVAPWPPPVVVGNSILYVQARGSILRDLTFSQQVEGLAGRDLTTFAQHLVDGYTLDSLDYQTTPDSTVWACRSDGTLLGLTYQADQDIVGWHRHDSGAQCRFEHVCVVPENGEDVVYVLVRRTINSGFVRYIERLESRSILNYNVDAFFVDSGLSYSGVAATTFSGLGHLEGQRVACLADGVVVSNGHDAVTLQVSGGAVTIPTAAQNVHIGLAIEYGEIETLDIDVGGSDIRDRRKRVGGVSLLVDASTPLFYAGPDDTHLMPYKATPYESTSGGSATGILEHVMTAAYNTTGRLLVQVRDPVPLTILGVIPNVEMGG